MKTPALASESIERLNRQKKGQIYCTSTSVLHYAPMSFASPIYPQILVVEDSLTTPSAVIPSMHHYVALPSYPPDMIDDC